MRPLHAIKKMSFVYIPMRDGVELCADISLPKKPGKYPAILMRTPYGRRLDEYFAARGYIYCSVDARATGASGGEYKYYNIEDGLHDGYDLVEWLAAQEYCDGNIGTLGGSALGAYQILTGCTRPPHLKCMCIDVPMLNFYEDQWYPGGVLRAENRVGWCSGLAGRISPGAVTQKHDQPPEGEAAGKRMRIYQERFRRQLESLRKGESSAEWAEKYFQNPVRNEMWDQIDMTDLMRNVEVPTMVSGVWWDHFILGTIAGYHACGGGKKLVVRAGWAGPQGDEGEHEQNELNLEWFEKYLKGVDNGADDNKVSLYFTGKEEWRYFDEYPESTEMEFFLTPGGGVGEEAGEGVMNLAHDPRDPAPSCGDIADNSEFAGDPRTLCFTASESMAGLSVCGQVKLRLKVMTEMEDANLVARFCAVKDGKSRMLQFGARKLSLRKSLRGKTEIVPGEWMDVELDFWPLAHAFSEADRLRIVLSLSDYPFLENSPYKGTLQIDAASAKVVLPNLNDGSR